MFKRLTYVTTLVLFLAIGVLAQEVPMTSERDKVLSHYGQSETVLLSLPVKKGIGVVSTQEVTRQGASALRLHFTIEAPAQSPSWAVLVRDKKNKVVWSYSSLSDAQTDFWTAEVPGSIATVEVLAVADITNLKLTIDRVIVSREATMIRSLTVNKLRSISDESQTIQGWGRAVARVLFVGDGNGQFLCTGFLLSPDLFMTNNHCIKTETEMRSGLAEFDYNREGATLVTLRFKEIVATNHDLDFTLLRLNENSGRQPLSVDLSAFGEGRALVIIQHPAGRPKQVSIDNCRVFGAQIAGVTSALTDFGHGCDTLGGSSGSPVLDIGSGKVLGLHHLGFLPNNQPVNRAVRIQQILDFLNQNLSDAAARQSLGLPAH